MYCERERERVCVCVCVYVCARMQVCKSLQLCPALCNPIVRKHLTGGFLWAVLDLSGILCSLLIPEYSGIKRRGKPLPGLRNPGISVGDKYPLPFYEPYGKSGYLQLSLSYG